MEKIEKTRQEVIDELIDAVIAGNSMEDMLFDGVKGYRDYTDAELIEEWKSWVGEDGAELAITGEDVYDLIARTSRGTLFYKKTDGGAEYLCTKAIEGTVVGDVNFTIIRLDGGAEVF